MNPIFTFLADSPFFCIILTIGLYLGFSNICKKISFPLLNPLLLTILSIIGLLVLFHIPYEKYQASGKMIEYFLTPATVCFAVPLYRQIHVLRRHSMAIFISIFWGSLASVSSILIMAKMMGLPFHIYASAAPKSVTTPIAMGIAEEMGGVAGCTVIADDSC